MLDVLGSESGIVQVRTSNSGMKGEDEKILKESDGLNLSSSTLLWATRPPADWWEQNPLHPLCIQQAKTLGICLLL